MWIIIESIVFHREPLFLVAKREIEWELILQIVYWGGSSLKKGYMILILNFNNKN